MFGNTIYFAQRDLGQWMQTVDINFKTGDSILSISFKLFSCSNGEEIPIFCICWGHQMEIRIILLYCLLSKDSWAIFFASLLQFAVIWSRRRRSYLIWSMQASLGPNICYPTAKNNIGDNIRFWEHIFANNVNWTGKYRFSQLYSES